MREGGSLGQEVVLETQAPHSDVALAVADWASMAHGAFSENTRDSLGRDRPMGGKHVGDRL